MFDPTTHWRRESERVTNLRDETQISTQTSRSWLRFSSEYLSNNLMGGGQRPHPARIFWVYSDFLSFSSLYSRLSESSGKMGQIDQIWGWELVFLHLKGWKTTIYHIYALILQCSLSRPQLKISAFSGKFNVVWGGWRSPWKSKWNNN